MFEHLVLATEIGDLRDHDCIVRIGFKHSIPDREGLLSTFCFRLFLVAEHHLAPVAEIVGVVWGGFKQLFVLCCCVLESFVFGQEVDVGFANVLAFGGQCQRFVQPRCCLGVASRLFEKSREAVHGFDVLRVALEPSLIIAHQSVLIPGAKKAIVDSPPDIAIEPSIGIQVR